MTNKKIVIIGGGTGQAVFLYGLKHYTNNITAVVPVTDNGSSSGMLREDLGMLPPGDVRSCILALADCEESMEDVFKYRFDRGRLEGQCLGNLIIAAMSEIYGSFEKGISKIGDLLAVKGQVLPVSLDNLQLTVELDNGKIVTGESGIKLEVLKQKSPIHRVQVGPNPTPYKNVLDEIGKAEYIVLGPGSLYTSLLADLVIPGIADAIRNSKAKKIYVANIMTQPGETDGMTILDHIIAIEEHVGKGLIDVVVANNFVLNDEEIEKLKVDDEDLKTGAAFKVAKEKYEEQEAKQLLLDDYQREEIKNRNIDIIETDLMEVKAGFIRHDAKKLSEIIINRISEKLDN
ncbi:MAG: YvcK family protein [Clostridia bacterium]|nr:YvcK family protein [Clostridia bacterium]